jgi:hypothetical protein
VVDWRNRADPRPSVGWDIGGEMVTTSSAAPPTDEDALEADLRRIAALADPVPAS